MKALIVEVFDESRRIRGPLHPHKPLRMHATLGDFSPDEYEAAYDATPIPG